MELISDYSLMEELQAAALKDPSNFQEVLDRNYRGIEVAEVIQDKQTGLDALVLRVIESSETYIIYEGSTDSKDWSVNLQNGLNEVPLQYQAALELADKYQGVLKGVGGNSLGGSLSQFVGAGTSDTIMVRTINAATINNEMLTYLETENRLNALPNVVNYYTETDILAPVMGIRDEQNFEQEGVFSYLINIGENKLLESNGSYRINEVVQGHMGNKQQTKFGAFHPLTKEYLAQRYSYSGQKHQFIYEGFPEVLVKTDEITHVTTSVSVSLVHQQADVQIQRRKVLDTVAKSDGTFATRQKDVLDYIDQMVIQLPGGFGFTCRMLYSESSLVKNFTHYLAAKPFIGKLLGPIFQKLQPALQLRQKLRSTLEKFTSACAEDLQIKDYTNTTMLLCTGPMEELLAKYLSHTLTSIEFSMDALTTYIKQAKSVAEIYQAFDQQLTSLPQQSPTMSSPKSVRQTDIKAKRQEIEFMHATLEQSVMRDGVFAKRIEVVVKNLSIFSDGILEIISYLNIEILQPLLHIVQQQSEHMNTLSMQTYDEWVQKYVHYQYETDTYQYGKAYEQYLADQAKAHQKLMLFAEELERIIMLVTQVDVRTITSLLTGLKQQLLHELIRDTVLSDVLVGMQKMQSSFEIITKLLGATNQVIWENKGKSITTLQNIGEQVEKLFQAVLSEILLYRL